MKRAFLVSAAAAALTFAAVQTASAQEWQGGYVGLTGGYADLDDNSSETVTFDTNLNGAFGDTVLTSTSANAFGPGPTPGGFCGGSPNANNFNAGCSKDDGEGEIGLRAGYDWQSGPWVYGVVGEVTKMNVSDTVTAFSITPARYAFTRELDTVVALRGRLGYAVDRFLPYVTAGGVYGKVKNSFATSNGVNSFSNTSNENDQGGYQIGAGVETKLATNWRVGVEYLHTNIDDDSNLTTRVGNTGTTPSNNPFLLVNPAGTDLRRTESELKVNSLRVTLSYSF